MIRNTSTIIVLTLFLSACCEKEGSFLNTVIKNHAAKIAAAAQQETIINQESSTLNANAAAIPVESTLTSLLKPNKENTSFEETELEALTIEKIVTDADLQQEEDSNKQTVAKLENSNTDVNSLDQLVTKSEIVETEAENIEVITETGQSESSIETEQESEDKFNESTGNVTDALDQDEDDPPIQIEEVNEQIVDQSPSQIEHQINHDQHVIAVIEKVEDNSIHANHSLNNEHSETKSVNDNKKEKLSKLVSLLNEEDNTAIEDIIEQTKAEELASGNESKFDRNKRLLELLSKDIKQQAQKPNSNISEQSLELLNDILSD